MSGLLGAIAIIWGESVKDKFADKRQSDNELATAKANETAALANAEAARANERANESELKLALLNKRIAPREVDRVAFLRELDGQPKAHVELMYVKDDGECFLIANRIRELLNEAKWDVDAPIPIPSDLPELRLDIPITMAAGGQPFGVSVIAHSLSDDEIHAGGRRMGGMDWVKTPYTVLENAILQSMQGVGGGGGGRSAPPQGTLRVIVGPKRP